MTQTTTNKLLCTRTGQLICRGNCFRSVRIKPSKLAHTHRAECFREKVARDIYIYPGKSRKCPGKYGTFHTHTQFKVWLWNYSCTKVVWVTCSFLLFFNVLITCLELQFVTWFATIVGRYGAQIVYFSCRSKSYLLAKSRDYLSAIQFNIWRLCEHWNLDVCRLWKMHVLLSHSHQEVIAPHSAFIFPQEFRAREFFSQTKIKTGQNTQFVAFLTVHKHVMLQFKWFFGENNLRMRIFFTHKIDLDEGFYASLTFFYS